MVKKVPGNRGGNSKKKYAGDWGVWDNAIGNWVINAKWIGADTARRVCKALNEPRTPVRQKRFWQE